MNIVEIQPFLTRIAEPPLQAAKSVCIVLFQAAGLATMISTMRPDIDNIDEYVRNTTAR